MAKSIMRIGMAALAIGLASFGGWLLSLPPATPRADAQEVPETETAATLASLGHLQPERPLVAVLGLNEATEATDYLVPAGILRRADIADVVLLATALGPVRLYNALTVEPDATIAAFDTKHPEGADYVIVPAMSRDDDPAVIAWLRRQADKGAKIVGICAGAKVVGSAGLLDGKRATTHWYYLREMLKRSPTIAYVANRRFVSDGNVVTTTGISASIPLTLTLIEAIAGQAKVKAVARDLGLDRWDARHASAAFGLTRPFAMTVLANSVALWNREELRVRLEAGMDEVTLALIADAWSRTYRSHVTTDADKPDAVSTANGVRVIPDRSGGERWDGHWVSTYPDRKPAVALDNVLDAISARYGRSTAEIVAMQFEYERP
ncbi:MULTISPECIES: DJ-1/PfpI family protein [unclassified Chelatococcus]|uniref:DJ-1/PfpI family protein n=1 Tax=unclassified Chelatococcus TaxID=2638111 RepID=UPI001BCB4088|nr:MULTISPECIES: DJ-1/PfpI family protein [unclassified Chelatococcus]MBS7700411.1 DJ-1/PfpI family protein [Chelatococcus sp. YT9]MBX3556207.1 DJ-1/PfpI family protein [Chelatococcus sp.]